MSNPEAMKVLARLDGILVPASLPLLRADDLGVLRGDGVFETTLAIAGVPRDLPEHLDRLQVSARMLEMSIPPPEAWRPGIDAAVAGWAGGDEMVLRLVATRGPEDGGEPSCYVLGSAPTAATLAGRRGIRVLLLDRGLDAATLAGKPYLLPGAKSLSYAVNMAAGRYARARGADDVIFVAPDGSVLEGPTSSVVLARGRSLVTPPREGILDGITARRLFGAAEGSGWSVATHTVTVDDLRAADGVYLTSSTRLLAPVTAIDGEDCRYDEDLTATLAALLGVPRPEPAR